MELFEKLVSAQTLQKFVIYERLIRLWNKRISLVQEDTLSDFYNRHILDSLQVIPLLKAFKLDQHLISTIAFKDSFDGISKLDVLDDDIRNLNIIDIGTGAGFPGLVLAICGFKNVVLCESNHKKCIFLQEVARQTDTKVRILNDRVENVKDLYDIVISRAFSSLTHLCFHTSHLCSFQNSLAIFLKGKSWEQEVRDAREEWTFDLTKYSSITSKDGVILAIHHLSTV